MFHPTQFVLLCALALPLAVGGCDDIRGRTKKATTQPSTQPTTQEASRPENHLCPVLEVAVDPTNPRLNTVTFEGKIYGVCCPNCVEEFEKKPLAFVPK